VQSLGLESVEKFSEGLRANIKNEKALRAREKRRAEILEELTKRSTIKYPAILREYELDDMEARLKADLERMGGTFEAYLAQVKKTREQLREEWKETGNKRAQVRLLLSEIARKENIDADQDALEREVKHAQEHVPNADPQALRAHIAHALKNEATLKFLEEQE
jgi:trigger factor